VSESEEVASTTESAWKDVSAGTGGSSRVEEARSVTEALGTASSTGVKAGSGAGGSGVLRGGVDFELGHIEKFRQLEGPWRTNNR